MWSKAKPWCGLYVKKQVDSDVTCRPGTFMEGICTNESKLSLSWPPEVNATLKNVWMILQYEFVSCSNYQTKSYIPSTASPGNI